MTIEIRKYPGDKETWNKFIDESNNGTIFHRLDFLEYHGDKFKANEHHLAWYKDGKLIAVMPMAIFLEPEILRLDCGGFCHKKVSYVYRTAKSPYGASYGGIVFKESLSLKDAEEIVQSMVSYLKELNVNKLIITVTPSIYLSKNSNYIDFFLLKCGAECINSDLTCYIDIVEDMNSYFNRSARKAVKKAIKNDVRVVRNNDVENFYSILSENRKKFNATPVHSIDDIEWLMNKMPDDIVLFMAYLDDWTPIAGSLVFKCNDRVILVFYWAHLDEYQQYRPISILVYEISKWAYENGIKFFDYGTQTKDMEVNYGGSRFKETFNATGVFRKTYKLVIK